jgi:hypothetical protein
MTIIMTITITIILMITMCIMSMIMMINDTIDYTP